MKTMMKLMVFLLAGLVCVSAGAQEAGPTAEEIITKIHDRFMGWGFKTMTYDELRVTSVNLSSDKAGAVMPLNTNNATTMKLRYFYKAPDSHGYKLLSEPINDYWIGSPNQPGALPMDHDWKNKLLAWYSPSRAEKTQVYRERDCYVVTLMPLDGTPANYPMTWYVDVETLNVLKFIFLFTHGTRKMHTTGEVFYEKTKDYLLPAEAHWTTKITMLPYTFKSDSVFSNYSFNMPLSDSVFEEEFPEDWFKKLDQIPYKPSE